MWYLVGDAGFCEKKTLFFLSFCVINRCWPGLVWESHTLHTLVGHYLMKKDYPSGPYFRKRGSDSNKVSCGPRFTLYRWCDSVILTHFTTYQPIYASDSNKVSCVHIFKVLVQIHHPVHRYKQAMHSLLMCV